eukprot:scaffold9105_cov58-Phaeocystis_antarctica.AAC.7
MAVLRILVLTCMLHASVALVLQPRAPPAVAAGRALTLGQLCELRTARAAGARLVRPQVRPVMSAPAADASGVQARVKARMMTAMKGGPDAKKELSAVRLMV